MRKLVVFMHVSLDGFVAGTKGEMDWINVDDEMFEYAGDQTDQADIALYGRITYEMMDSYWPTAGDEPNASKHDKQHSAWYNSVLKVVASTTMSEGNTGLVKVIGSDITSEIKKIKNAEGKNIVVFGSPTLVHALTAEELVDEYWLFVNPVLIGEGIPMFKSNDHKQKLSLVSSNTFKSGVVCIQYKKA